MLRQHLQAFGTAPDGRLFRGARGGMLSESAYGRTWHAARQAAIGPGLAATPLARRPYDLRHAALSLWLNASGAPPRSPPGPGTAPASFMRSTSTAPTASEMPSASGSKTPSTRALARHRRHGAGKGAVTRTVGTTPDAVRYMYVSRPICAADPADSRVQARTAPESRAEAPSPEFLRRERHREHVGRATRTPGMFRLPTGTARPCTCRLPVTHPPLLLDQHLAAGQRCGPSRTRSSDAKASDRSRSARERQLGPRIRPGT